MKRTKKASIAVSAALAAGGLMAAKALADDALEKAKPSPDAGVAEKEAPKDAKKHLVKVKKAKPPTGETDIDLAMPAGTLYDVISRRDVP